MSLPLSSRVPATKIRVLLVDDSAVVRGLVLKWLEGEADIEIAGAAINGRDGVKLAKQVQPDIIILDIEMPEMDGLTAIPQLLQACPKSKMLMASTLTQRNAEISLRALGLGATDYIPKPGNSGIAGAADFKRDLLAKIRGLGGPKTPRSLAFTPAPAAPPQKRVPGAFTAQILVVGCSTGGPQALTKLVTDLAGRFICPILIVQHMPPMFTTILAGHLDKASNAQACEAKDGMLVKQGGIYLAPGDHHLKIQRRHGALVLTLDKTPPVNFCRPSVDPLFMSACEVFGAHTLGLILTGMGHDGRAGAQAIGAKGGLVMAQDEASSVVWGMPGAVVRAGLAHEVKPLGEIPKALLAINQGRM